MEGDVPGVRERVVRHLCRGVNCLSHMMRDEVLISDLYLGCALSPKHPIMSDTTKLAALISCTQTRSHLHLPLSTSHSR